MSTPLEAPPRGKRPADLLLGVLFALLTGVIALFAAKVGFQGRGSAADGATIWPNLITGSASLVGAAGYLQLRKWSVPIYAVAVAGHFASHLQLLAMRAGSGRLTVANVVLLALPPLLALAVLTNMWRQRKQGFLQ